MTPLPTIAPAAASDAGAIAALLRAAELPHADFAPHLAHFLVARLPNGEIVGTIGAEVGGCDALLRSLVVAPAWRGQGLGRELLAALDRAGAGWDVGRWWLLTTTAGKFFSVQGFVPKARAAAPPAITATGEFQGLCPSVAECWSRERRAP